MLDQIKKEHLTEEQKEAGRKLIMGINKPVLTHRILIGIEWYKKFEELNSEK